MMDDHNVQRDVGILRGEMTGVQKDVQRVERKVDEGFLAITLQIQSLKGAQDFARGVSYIITGIIAAVVSTIGAILLRMFAK